LAVGVFGVLLSVLAVIALELAFWLSLRAEAFRHLGPWLGGWV
jgi:hypothetical protein